MPMPTTSQIEALRLVVEVRWRLLESYALARQEGLVEPVGLVIDTSTAYGREVGQHVLVGASWSNPTSKTVTCMERSVLCGVIAPGAAEVAAVLRDVRDEPGRWATVVLAERGWVLTGTWQELMMAPAESCAKPGRSRAR
jgi:hypothetical protein